MEGDDQSIYASMAARLLAAHTLESISELSIPDQLKLYEAIGKAIPDLAARTDRLVSLLNEYRTQQRLFVAEFNSRGRTWDA